MTNQKIESCCALRLFAYYWDCYECREVVEVEAVSFDPGRLRSHFEGLDHFYSTSPLVGFSEHITLAKREETHWTIEPIRFLHNESTSTKTT